MTSTSSTWVLVAGLGLLAGAAGAVFGARVLADDGPRFLEPDPTSTIDDAGAEEIVAVLRDLTREVELLRETLQSSPPPRPEDPGPQRVPMGSDDHLERTLERIAAALEAQRPYSAGTEVAAGLGHPPFKPKETNLLEELRAIEGGLRTRPYYFWSMDEILERFGCPDEVSGSDKGGWDLLYKLGEESYVQFFFTQHLLTYIGSDRE